MTHQNTHTEPKQKIFGTLREDIRRGDFTSSIRREFRDAKEFMLDERRKKRLSDMTRLRRWLYTGWWLLKSMFFKLTPGRRILVAAGVILVTLSGSVSYSDQQVTISTKDTDVLGALCILFVLMLELKDKLVARKELEAGRAVQEALMPERSPAVPGWQLWLFTRSANEVGGDLVDLVKVSNERVGVVLGDVAGKGLRAALLMVKLQATLRALAPDFTSLSALAAKLNEIFCRDSLRNIFASMVYAEFRPESGEVRLVNAGHLPPVVVMGGKVVPLPKGGPALGIAPGAAFMEQGVTLKREDLLCVYSDGLTEAENQTGDFLGEQRLLGLLSQLSGRPIEEIGLQLVAEVDRFIGDAQTRDDLSIALIRRTQ
jgi:hypothetical protein